MQTAPRWAANLAKFMGAISWGMGVLFHLGLFSFIASLVVMGFSDFGPGPSIYDWREMLHVSMALLSGPGAVLVGGGLRFLGGLMAGNKVAGEQAPRILLFEWLRYELIAIGAASLLSSLGILFSIRGDVAWSAALLFISAVIFGTVCMVVGARCGKKSGELMWQVREQGIRSGQIPYPADAIAPKRPFGDLSWETAPDEDPTSLPKDKKRPHDSVSAPHNP